MHYHKGLHAEHDAFESGFFYIYFFSLVETIKEYLSFILFCFLIILISLFMLRALLVIALTHL